MCSYSDTSLKLWSGRLSQVSTLVFETDNWDVLLPSERFDVTECFQSLERVEVRFVDTDHHGPHASCLFNTLTEPPHRLGQRNDGGG